MGAMVIFSLILMNMNRFMLLNDMALMQNEYQQVALAAGQSIVNEAKVLKFDENDDPDPDDVPDSFTQHYALGPGYNESRNDPSDDPFDDFDDFNDYNTTRTINGVEYNINVDVCYVQESDLDDCYSSETEHKLMTVKVNNKFMDHLVRLQMVKSYY
jgi:hypothetical protein